MASSGKSRPRENEGLFAPIASELLKDSAISEGRMFGASGLKVGGKVCAMLVRGRLVVKLPSFPPRLTASMRSPSVGEDSRRDAGFPRWSCNSTLSTKDCSKTEEAHVETLNPILIFGLLMIVVGVR